VCSSTTPPDLAHARRLAIKDSAPLLVPAVPFGFVLGVAISESPIPDGVGLFTSLAIFAGAAQLAFITLVGTASIWAAMAAALVINARHVMYSAALAPVFKPQPRWFRLVAPFVLIDQVFALANQHADEHPDYFRRYYTVVGLLFFGVWQIVTVLGLFFGSFVPVSIQIGFAPAIMFTGLVIFGITNRPGVVAAMVGAMVCFATLGLPNRVGLLIGAACGVTAGYLAEVAIERRSVPA